MSDEYDKIFASVSGGVSQPHADPYDAIFASVAPKAGAAEPAMPQPKVQGTGSDMLDTANAVGTGYSRGLARLAGLPVDTLQNVIDLGKAGLGTAYTAATGKVAPDALQVGDRSDRIMSGDWIIRNLGKTKVGNVLMNPANPEYEGGYAQAAGGGLTAVMAPNTVPQAINQGVLGVTSAIGSKAVGDLTGSPAAAIAAGMSPLAVQQAVTAGTKFAVRGGERGRQEMAQRVQDLQNSGIDQPTLGLASGNKVIGGVENILQSTPGAVGVMGRARDRAVAGLQAKAEESAGLASPNTGTFEAGQAIQNGVNNVFKERFKANQGRLYDRVEQEVGSQYPTPVANTRAALSAVNSDIPGAPALSQFFKNSKIQALEDALRQDTAGAPASVQVHKRVTAGGGLMNTPVEQFVEVPIPAGPQRNTLPFEAIKKTRTMVGNEIADSNIASAVPRSKWNPLYGALSEDMRLAANEAGGNAPQVFNRANNYTRAGMDRLDRIAPFGQMAAPEQAFTAMERAARENVSTLQAVKKSLPQDARGQVAGTIIERLGKATNGQQNATSTAWSPETFLTNWNKMAPKARDELFSGFQNAPEVKANVEAIAQATSMMRDSSKMWANPSGTGANVTARATLGALGLGGGASALGLLNPAVPVAVGGGLLGTYGLARGLTSPMIVKAMTERNTLSPGLLNAQFNSLVGSGLLAEQR